MQRLSRMAAAVTLALLPAGVVLAQNAPNSGTSTTTPATAVAPAPTTTAPATTPPSAAEPSSAPKKKKSTKMTRQQEIDRSIDNGTVPARYRNQVPKEYQQYIPFDK